MNTADETQTYEENSRKQADAKAEVRPDPAEETIKEFEEYLWDIGVRI